MHARFLRELAPVAALAAAGLAVLGAARQPQQKLLSLAVLRDA